MAIVLILIIAGSRFTAFTAVWSLENPSVYKPTLRGATCLNNAKLLKDRTYEHKIMSINEKIHYLESVHFNKNGAKNGHFCMF